MKKWFTSSEIRPDYSDAGDFLRAACIGMIGWYHIWQQSWLNPDFALFGHRFRLYPLVACGYMFVDLMLLLSGFLLMLGFLSGRGRKTAAFYTARAARILPCYLFCIAVMLFGFALPGRQYGSGKHMWTDILAHLSFTHNLFPESYTGTRLNGALWTLAVEVQFYIFFPLLARQFEKKPALTCGCMIGIAWLYRILVHLFVENTTLYINQLPAMLDVYAVGMAAALIFRRLADRPQKAWRAWLSTLLTVLSIIAIYYLLDRQLSERGQENIRAGQLLRRFPLSLAGSMFIVCGSRSIRLLRKLFSNRVTRFLSGISFNFYIWHQFIAVKLKEWHIPAYEIENPNAAGLQPWQSTYTACCFAAALIMAVLCTWLIEKPCSRLIRRSLSSRKSS